MAENGNGPIRTSTFQNPKFISMYGGVDHADVARDLSNRLRPIRPVPGIAQAWDIISVELGNALTQKKTAQKAMDDAAEQINKAMKQ